MRNLIAALAVGVVGVGFAVSAQAAPTTKLAPLTTLNQSSIQQAQYGYGHCRTHKVCNSYGHHCRYVRRCGGHH